MKKRIKEYLPKALEALSKFNIEKEGEVARPFNGYISSFGASLRCAGLLATTLFYGKKGNADENRQYVLKAIEYIIGQEIVQNGAVSKETRAKVEDAAIALKLSVRTFKLI